MTMSNAPTADLRDVMTALLAEYPHLTRDLLVSKQRTRRIARPRQVAFLLSRELTPASLPKIGRFYGGRDHTTVLHGCRRINALCQAGDMDLELSVEAVRKRVMTAFAPDMGIQATGFRARLRQAVEADPELAARAQTARARQEAAEAAKAAKEAA